MSILLGVNEQTKSLLNEHFTSNDVLKASRLLEEGKDSISFKKGDPKRYFVVSGILHDDKTEESKISFRKEENKANLKSQCTCLSWSEDEHCPHSAALFIRFHLLNQEMGDLPDTRNHQMMDDKSVSVSEYGTVIDGPEKLRGRYLKSQATYFAYNYKLTTGENVNFPIPKKFEGKLILNLYPTYKFFLDKADFNIDEIPKELYTPRFSLEINDKNIKEISLFELIYFFDWTSGTSYHIPKELNDFLQVLRQNHFSLEINDYLNYAHELLKEEAIKIHIDDKSIEEFPEQLCRFQLNISNSQKKNYLNVQILSKDSENSVIPLVKQHRFFAFEHGLLNSFSKKNQAYEFLGHLYNYSLELPNKLNSLVRSSKQRDLWDKGLKLILEQGQLKNYLPSRERIYLSSNKEFLTIIFSLIKHFGEQSFRFSEINLESGSIEIDIRKSKVIEGVSGIFEDLGPLGVPIYYQDKIVSTWKSNIIFSRRKTDINWFGLDLELSPEDLQIIKKADLDETHVLTNHGLTLFTKEQRSLLKFMKKYVNYEGTSDDGDSKKEKKYKFELPFRRSRIFELFELKKLGIDGILTKEEEDFCERLMSLEEIPDYSIPSNYEGLLRPYQKTGYNWMRFLFENKFGACLADDMGLGKTLQSISFLESISGEIEKCLIVCPISILMNWQNEFEKFSNLSEQVQIYYGGDRELDPTKKFILTSYGVMKKEAHGLLGEIDFDVFVLDEVQNLKNVRSLGATAARNIKSKFRICLTGTPVENDLSEFYNIMDLAVPGIWGNADYLRTRSVKKSRLIARKSARPFILRRTKKEVLKDLPPKTENLVYLRFGESERENYLFNLTRIRKRINSVLSKRKYGEVLKGLLELRQLCLWQKGDELLSTKIKYLMKNLEQITQEGHKTLIFSQFTTYLDIIEQNIKEKNIPFSRIDGSYSLKKRNENIEKFQNGDNQVFLISLKAGGLGLNLTAASYIFLMDPWWNPAVENQAIDRAHRIGQKNSLNVFRLIMKDSIEEKVLKLQEMKKELFNELLNSGDSSEQYFTGKLSMKDFEMLLGDSNL